MKEVPTLPYRSHVRLDLPHVRAMHVRSGNGVAYLIAPFGFGSKPACSMIRHGRGCVFVPKRVDHQNRKHIRHIFFMGEDGHVVDVDHGTANLLIKNALNVRFHKGVILGSNRRCKKVEDESKALYRQ